MPTMCPSEETILCRNGSNATRLASAQVLQMWLAKGGGKKGETGVGTKYLVGIKEGKTESLHELNNTVKNRKNAEGEI